MEHRLLPAVCATRANYHAVGHIALMDVHTKRLTQCAIEIFTAPHGHTAIYLNSHDRRRELKVIEWADEGIAGAAAFVGALRTAERWEDGC